MERDIEREKLLEELAKLPQIEEQANNIDDTSNCGYELMPVPETHWSQTEAWKSLRATMTAPEPTNAKEEPEVSQDWYSHALNGLAGFTDEETA